MYGTGQFGQIIFGAENGTQVIVITGFFDYCLSATMTQHHSSNPTQHNFTSPIQHHSTNPIQHFLAEMKKCP